ncbi:hypothetical protein ILYODFUR_016226, partial [Ilyodon furcidens]
MERKQWLKNFRKPFLFAAAVRDHKMPLERMRHQQIRPRGKHSHAIKEAAATRQSLNKYGFISVICVRGRTYALLSFFCHISLVHTVDHHGPHRWPGGQGENHCAQ